MGQRFAGLSWDGFMEEKQQIFGKSRRGRNYERTQKNGSN
jgi:hypothetical protein